MVDLRTAHTADLDAATLAAVRVLLDDAFAGEFTDQDWDHTLGGMHATAWEGTELVRHGAVIQRRLLHCGQALRTGYVEGVAVRADRRRRGHAGMIMSVLERVIRGGYQLGALSATEQSAGLYAARGWQVWQGVTSVLAPYGRVRTEEDDDAVYVLPLAVPVDLIGDLTCDWRDGDAW